MQAAERGTAEVDPDDPLDLHLARKADEEVVIATAEVENGMRSTLAHDLYARLAAAAHAARRSFVASPPQGAERGGEWSDIPGRAPWRHAPSSDVSAVRAR